MEHSDHTIIFVGGLHRSGTSLVARCLAEHPSCSGFKNTGKPEDEGQKLQSVYPPAGHYGGPGKFGFAKAMHIVESSPLVTEENRQRLWSEWSKHWDLSRSHLVEKSPPNLIKARFLQAVFPRSNFVFVLRHPIAVTGATKKWKRRTPLSWLVEHWVVCHEIMRADLEFLERTRIVHYEDFVADPRGTLAELFDFLGLPSVEPQGEIRSGVNESYFRRWEQWKSSFWKGRSIHKAEERFEERVNALGYSLINPRAEVRSPWSLRRIDSVCSV